MTKKKYLSPDESEYSWVADSAGGGTDDESKYLINHRDEIKVLGGYDISESYEFDITALILLHKRYYLLTTSGCSCPSPDERWVINFGPTTKKEMIEYLQKGTENDKQLVILLSKELSLEEKIKQAKIKGVELKKQEEQKKLSEKSLKEKEEIEKEKVKIAEWTTQAELFLEELPSMIEKSVDINGRCRLNLSGYCNQEANLKEGYYGFLSKYLLDRKLKVSVISEKRDSGPGPYNKYCMILEV